MQIHIKKNVGTLDATIRITFGLAGLSIAIARMVRQPYRSGPFILALFSAMKVAEGFTRFCPMLAWLGLNTNKYEEKRKAVAQRTSSLKTNQG